MRLFRRILLCLVVGVTAFGAAGWGFRPRASWSIELDPTSEWSFINGEAQRHHDEILWLHRAPGEEADELTAISPTDGIFLSKVPLAFDKMQGVERAWDLREEDRVQARVLPNGDVAVHRRSRKADDSCVHEFFRVRLNGDPQLQRFALDDWWELTPDWTHAWRVDWGGTFTLANALTGAVERTLKFGPEYKRLDGSLALAPDARTLAVAEGGHDARRSGDGIELWDIATGRFVRRIKLTDFGADATKSKPQRLVAKSPEYLENGNVLAWTLVDPSEDESVHHHRQKREHDHVYFDLSADRFIAQRHVLSPRPDSGGTVYLYDERDGCQAWVYLPAAPIDEALLSVRNSPNESPSWRRIPYQLSLSAPKPSRDGSDWNGLTIHLVNDSVIAKMREKSPLAAVPEIVTRWAPATWDEPVERYRWHKLETNAWSDIGCRGNTLDQQVRSDALFTITSSNGVDRLLQSWPLPPRDPKWPALGVAIACAAGTWWFCAWRYRRRMKRATIATVTA